MQLVVTAPNTLPDAAAQLLQHFSDTKIWLITGEMGAGKTTLIKQFCHRLHVIDLTASPSFSLLNEYHTRNGGIVFHADLYRIANLAELNQVGLTECLDGRHLIFIEWPEIIIPQMTVSYVLIEILVNENSGRVISAKKIIP